MNENKENNFIKYINKHIIENLECLPGNIIIHLTNNDTIKFHPFQIHVDPYEENGLLILDLGDFNYENIIKQHYYFDKYNNSGFKVFPYADGIQKEYIIHPKHISHIEVDYKEYDIKFFKKQWEKIKNQSKK